MVQSDNRRIAKNTLYLYVRTILVLLISLYTSREVLAVLGIDNYGIYNVVAGVIALLSFFQAAQSKATSRFITYELGASGLSKRLSHVFASSITIHLITALLAIIICETIGLYIITHWTNIPADKHFAAHVVYQFAILIFCVHLLRIPFDAAIIAHEEMSVFAYFSIIEVILQLGLVFIVKYAHCNALILYSALMFVSALILLALYVIYVCKKFPIYKIRLLWDKDLGKRMISFSGWTLMGASTNAATQQGVNLLMNNFVGLVANASMGITGQVNAAVSKFIQGFSTAFTPQIIKLYAQDNTSQLRTLISRSSKFSFALAYILVLPILCNIDMILHLWLGDNVPEYAAGFCTMILIGTVIDATSGVYNIAITATGKIKYYQIWISLSFILDLTCSAVLLYMRINPVLVFSSRIFTRGFLNMAIGLYFTNRNIGYDLKSYLRNELLRISILIAVTALPTYWLWSLTNGWEQLLVTTVFAMVSITTATYYLLMNKSEQKAIMSKLLSKMHRI